jgi:hypothetical protein
MNPAVRQVYERPIRNAQKVKEIEALLPADDQELDQWIEELIRNGEGGLLTFLLIAAVGSDRLVDARHLVRGTPLMADPALAACLALRMSGDPVEALLGLVRETHMIVFHGPPLVVAAEICRERRNGEFPPELLTQARVLARNTTPEIVRASSLAVAAITRDPALAEILKLKTEKDWKLAEGMAEKVVGICRQHPLTTLVPEPDRILAEGFTMRRAVAKVGRNDPCPCQSGRKYKQCCMAKDEERLRDSSHVAGKSHADLRAEPEFGVTRAKVRKTPLQDLLRIDPRKIAEDAQEELVFCLSGSMYFDRAVECLELVGFPERLDDVCFSYALFAARAGRKDALENLLKKHPRSKEIHEGMFLSAKLLLAEDDPASIAPLMEREALAALQENDPYPVLFFADGLLQSKYMALGILVGRSAIIQMEGDNDSAQRLLKELLMARDRLNLPPDDIMSEVLEKRWLAAAEKKEREEGTEAASALAEAREKLEVKIREMHRLQQSLDSLHRDVQDREKRLAELRSANQANALARKSQAGAADEEKLAELRFKVEELKNVLKEHQEERVSLRQELREVYGKLNVQTSARPQEDHSVSRQEQKENEAEAKHLLPEEAVETQPLRLPVFPADFHSTLESLPKHVARSAVAMIGRLASGEAAAFQGVLRLKVVDSVYRQRIGRDHRLLFRLLSDQLVVIDLINRRDLDRRIKTLD